MRFHMSNVNINNGGQNSNLQRLPTHLAKASCHSCCASMCVCVCLCRPYLARPLRPTCFRPPLFSLHTFRSISCICRACASTSAPPLLPPVRTFHTRLLPSLNLYDRMASALSSSTLQRRWKCSAIVRYCGHVGLFFSCKPFSVACFCFCCRSSCYSYSCVCVCFSNWRTKVTQIRRQALERNFENHKRDSEQKWNRGISLNFNYAFRTEYIWFMHTHVHLPAFFKSIICMLHPGFRIFALKPEVWTCINFVRLKCAKKLSTGT